MSIIDLQEISPNSWKALYQGNYGKYTIKIKIDGDKIVDFSCSCPSDYYPCKHIPMIEKAIRQRIGERIEDSKHGIKFEELLKDSTQKELYDFIIRRAKYDLQLKNAILMEFLRKLNEKNTYNLNIYTQILQNALSKIHFDYEDMDEYDSINIDELDRWLDKAQEYVEDNIPEEAVLICKACIEEFASWCEKQESYIVENVDISHKERPFKILFQILDLPNVDYKGLLDYCKSEILKPKYKEAEMYYDFNELFMKLSNIVGTDDFIKLQDKLLQEIDDFQKKH
jgi:hypothetical protein